MPFTQYGTAFLFGLVDPAPDLGDEYHVRLSDRDWVIAHHHATGKNYYVLSNPRCTTFPWVLVRCIPAARVIHFEETVLYSPQLDDRAILTRLELARIGETLTTLGRGFAQVSLALRSFGRATTPVIERSMRHHTGRRVPGSNRTRRLRKKRFTAITRWMASIPA